MSNAWGAFYWGDYIADTGHLTLAQHGAYLLLMAHYYRTRRPLPANAPVLHRVCRCATAADRDAVDAVLLEFFTLDADVYRQHRVDRELAKAIDISGKRSAAARAKHEKSQAANAPTSAPANAEQVHTQPQPQPQLQRSKSKACARPTIEDVKAYCHERKNQVDPQLFVDHYSANGWKVGRNPLKDWKAAVRTWERNGVNHANGNGNRAERRQAGNIAAGKEAVAILENRMAN